MVGSWLVPSRKASGKENQGIMESVVWIMKNGPMATLQFIVKYHFLIDLLKLIIGVVINDMPHYRQIKLQ